MRVVVVLLLVVLMVFGLAVPVMAGPSAPCTSSNPHGSITYTSHGVTHSRVLKAHVYTTDTYNVYEKRYVGGGPVYDWVLVGNAQCYYGPLHW